MALAAENPNDRAQQLVALSERLTGLLERETNLFLARTPQKAVDFAEEKNQLARIYRNETMRISKNPALIKNADARIKSDLAEATKRFNCALNANHQANTAIRTITEGMVKSVATEVANKRAAQSGYGANGSNAPPQGVMAAITLNKVV